MTVLAVAVPSFVIDPSFAESVVRRVLEARRASDPALRARHASRAEPIYAISDARERNAAFERLALAEFEELGLADLVRSAIEERPVVAGRVRVVLLGEAAGRLDEGITWEPSGAHLGLRIDPARFDRPDGLGRWARHVLGHAEDTLDPAFGFRPGWLETSLSRPVQQRVHDLWDVTIDARTDAAGLAGGPAATRQEHRARLAGQFPACSDAAIEALVDRLWSGPRPMLRELVAWASDPQAMDDALSGGALSGAVMPGAARPRLDRCPLCRFPGDDIRPPDRDVAILVVQEYPDWRPAHGLCGRCADRFRFVGLSGGHR